jgi:hypothetical protein
MGKRISCIVHVALAEFYKDLGSLQPSDSMLQRAGKLRERVQVVHWETHRQFNRAEGHVR